MKKIVDSPWGRYEVEADESTFDLSVIGTLGTEMTPEILERAKKKMAESPDFPPSVAMHPAEWAWWAHLFGQVDKASD